MPGQVIDELHMSTFTPEGTVVVAARELAALRRLGIPLTDVMPVAEFPSRWNGGYEDVGLYAPSSTSGDAAAFQRFVEATHVLGLGVLLDVVYNHLGPDGTYLTASSDAYFTDRSHTDWGAALDFDGSHSHAVREFISGNACYWIAEFHLDGLCLDATQNLYDAGPIHVLAKVSQRARETAGHRQLVLIAENEPQQIQCWTPVEQGGYGLDVMWNDDFHHAARVALTGCREASYTGYHGEAQELRSTLTRGFLYQGQRSHWQHQPRGSAVTTQPAQAFVIVTQNHEQVANTRSGERLTSLTRLARDRALTALMLLTPGTPMRFMGQEFGSSSPFLSCADHGDPALGGRVYQGRKESLTQFLSYCSPEAQAGIPDPCASTPCTGAKLAGTERLAHAPSVRFPQDLLRLRRDDALIARQDRTRLDGTVLEGV
jgi:maltooligosyltrehalose trehalohydrolase